MTFLKIWLIQFPVVILTAFYLLLWAVPAVFIMKFCTVKTEEKIVNIFFEHVNWLHKKVGI